MLQFVFYWPVVRKRNAEFFAHGDIKARDERFLALGVPVRVGGVQLVDGRSGLALWCACNTQAPFD